MPTNIPVRLVRKDGGLIPLNVTTLTLDVDRSINPHTIPYMGGERFAFDLNMAKAVILLEGVITDDDLVSVELGRSAKASIDFSTTGTEGVYNSVSGRTNSIHQPFVGSTLTALAAELTADVFTDTRIPRLTIQAKDGTSYIIFFIKSNTTYGYDLGTGLSSEKYHVSIAQADGTMRTAVEIAGYLRDLINSSANSNALSSRFTATRVDSTNTDEADTTVVITLDTAGRVNGNNTPSWEAKNRRPPLSEFFTGGVDTASEFTSMSAGDKVMSLYATLNNSNDGGSIVPVVAGAQYAQQVLTGGSKLNKKYGDYIKGIQIPFNSTVNNSTGDKYVAKNFFMPTGPFHDIDSKHPNKAKDASSRVVNPNATGDKAFIKGTVTKATFVQLGGEPIYQFNIQFVPVEHII